MRERIARWLAGSSIRASRRSSISCVSRCVRARLRSSAASGERHALQRNAEPLRQFDLYDGERYRVAKAPVEHVVEVAVARIVVILVVAAETEVLEQELIQRA